MIGEYLLLYFLVASAVVFVEELCWRETRLEGTSMLQRVILPDGSFSPHPPSWLGPSSPLPFPVLRFRTTSRPKGAKR